MTPTTRFIVRLVAGLIVSFLLVPALHAQESTPVDTTTKAIEPIPIYEIPDASVELIHFLQSDVAPVIRRHIVSATQPTLDSLRQEVQLMGQISTELLDNHLPYAFYQSLALRWNLLLTKIGKPGKILNDYSVELESLDEKITERQSQWKLSQPEEGIGEGEFPEEIASRIEDVLEKMDSIRQELEDSLKLSLTRQGQVTDLKLAADNNILKLQYIKQAKLEALLVEKKNPIWSLSFKEDSSSTVMFDNQPLLQFGVEDSISFWNAKWGAFMGLVVIFVLFVLMLLGIRKTVDFDKERKGEDFFAERFVFNNVFSFALMFTLIMSLWTLPEMPYFVNKLYVSVFLLPFLIVFPGMVIRQMRWTLYYLVLLYWVYEVAMIVLLNSNVLRVVAFIEFLLLLGYLAWVVRNRNKIKVPEGSYERRWYKFLFSIAPPFLIYVLLGLVANIVGYETFATTVLRSAIVSLLIALVLGVGYISLRGVLAVFFETRFAQISNIIREDKTALSKRLFGLLWTGTVLTWLYFTLKSMLLWDPLSSWAIEIWELGYQFGDVSITIGTVLSFFLIVILSWIISFLIRILLNKEILTRMNLARGVPMAISSITQYFFVTLGFVLALAYAGFTLENLGLMVGALGVGIGFGLQTIVNNFLSGLILVFERPVTQGDRVRVDGIEGIVTSIGIRASRIREYDGAELIVPNSALISNKVTNWSLSQFKRRYILTINTDVGVDPEEVQALMTQAALKVEDVERMPEPTTYFQGIEDQSLEFALYYWISDNILSCNSEVNVEVHKALRENGVKILIPRRVEIRQGPSMESYYEEMEKDRAKDSSIPKMKKSKPSSDENDPGEDDDDR